MTGEHRIDIAGKPHVAVENGVAQLFVAVLAAQHLELVMKVEDHRRMGKAARRPAGLRMKADDEECLPAEAEREMGIVRVGAHSRVMILAPPGILVGQRLDPIPQAALELLLAEAGRAFEDDGETGEERRLLGLIPSKAHQPFLDGDVIP
jgi:hypothetical protein